MHTGALTTFFISTNKNAWGRLSSPIVSRSAIALKFINAPFFYFLGSSNWMWHYDPYVCEIMIPVYTEINCGVLSLHCSFCSFIGSLLSLMSCLYSLHQSYYTTICYDDALIFAVSVSLSGLETLVGFPPNACSPHIFCFGSSRRFASKDDYTYHG